MISREQLDYATDGTAWKTPSMRGFIFKTVLNETTYGAGAYKLTLRKAANDGGNPQDEVYYFNIDSTKADVNPSDAHTAANVTQTLVFDKGLMGHILNSNWIQGTYADFEAARTGSGGDW